MKIVETTCGKIKGHAENNLDVFKGIPYAEPPVGELRFRPPQAKKPWDGVLNANEFGACAFQAISELQEMMDKLQPESEDCLTLNIWTPGIDNRKRPVMFWIHGGGYLIGGSKAPAYNGAHLAQRGDVVVVTINYRLGAFGYLHVPGETANAGQLDQVMALQWVYDNVAKFGGDPENITIFGESAGAYSTITIATMPLADGLYRRIIAQSMPTINPKISGQTTKDFFKLMGIEEGDFRALSKIHPEKIIKAQSELTKKGGFIFRPYIDGKTISSHPLKAFKEGKLRNIDLMMGTNLHEAKLFTALNPLISNIKDERAIIAYLSIYGIKPEKAIDIINIYKKAQPKTLSNNPKELLDSIATDLMFRVATLQVIEAHSKFQRNAYNYLFTWESKGYDGKFGSCHALEVPFVFHTLEETKMKSLIGDVSDSGNLSEIMMDAWLSFAHTGNPNHDAIPEWPHYDEEKRSTLIFGKDIKVDHSLFEKERKAWDGIIGNY